MPFAVLDGANKKRMTRRELEKNTAHIQSLSALANLFMARRQLAQAM